MAGYSARQSSFTTGDTIEAADSNDEFNQILAAFHVSTGHTHDGTTAGDGGPLSTLYSNAISMGTGADTDIVLTFNANTSDGVITWMEDEDYFKFSDDILVNSTEKLQFRDTAIYLYSSADGQLDLVADTEIQIAATTVDINGNVDISGSLTLGGTAITSTAAELNLMDGGTSATSTTVADADRVVYNDAGTMKQVAVTDLDTYISATSKTLTNKTLTSPVLNTGVSGTAVADEDDMSSNSATKLATQQSIKAYVDAQITAEDLDVTSDSGTIAIDLDSETLTIAGGTGLDSSATSNTVTLAIDSTVATLTGSQTLTNKTLTSPVLNTGVSGTAVLDEDNFASDSATKVATQQSIKAYVDAVSTGVTSFVMEDDDGTEVTISNNKEIKYIGSGLTTNWTDTDNGTDGDPYDLTFTVDAAQTGITSLLATDIKIGEDDETKIDFETANEIHFYANNTEQVYLADNIFGPQSDSDVDLGTTGVRWKDAYIDTITTTGAISVGGDLTVNGTTTTVNSTTVTIDDPIFTLGGDSAPGSDDNKDRGIEFRYHNGTAAKVGFFGWDDSATAFTFIPDASNSSEVFSGTVGNAVFGNITGTLQTAAQTNITSVGALDGGSITSGFGTIDTGSSNITTTGLISGGSLDIDNVLINGTTIGHTDDTDLMTLSNGGLVVAGTLEATGNITGTLATAAQTNITSTGALDGGSITSGFGAIDNGTSGIRTNTFTAETSIVPDASGGADLGSTSLEWGDLYIADDKKIYLGSDQNLSIEYDEDGNDTTALVAAGGLSMAPHGSSAGNGTELRFQELAANGANYVGFKAPDAIASNEVWVLPNADGSANQVLKTDGSNALGWVDAPAGGEMSLVADGAIAAQKPVVLTSAGKAAQVKETTTVASTPTVKSVTTMDDSDTTSVPVNTAYESNSGAFVMVYKDASNSSYGTAVAGTWSDGTMTWGTPAVFESSAIDDEPHICAGGNRVHVTYRASDGVGGIRSASISGTTLTFAAETTWTTNFGAASSGLDEMAAGTVGRIGSAYDASADRYLTAYTDEGNSYYGTAVVSQLTDANTGAMTWGTPVVFVSESVETRSQGVAYDSNTSRSLILYKGSDNVGHAVVATVTAGTNAVAYGSEATFNSDGTSNMVAVEDPSTDRILVVFADNGDSEKGKATVATITGGTTNTVAFGTQATFESGSIDNPSAAYSPDLTKSLIVWGHKQDKLGEVAVATVTGGTTNTVAFGSPATFSAAGTKGSNDSITYSGCAYDTVGDRFVIAFGDPGDSSHSKVIGCTVSGTTPSFGTAVKLQADGGGDNHMCVADPTGEAVYVGYTNGGASDRGYIHRITGTGTTVADSTTLNWSGTDASSYISAAYDPDMDRATFFVKDSGQDLNSLTLIPYDGHQPTAYLIAYDSDNNNVVVLYSDGTTAYVRAISHDTSDGTYTAVGAKASPASFNMVSKRADILYDPDANRAVIAYVDASNSDRATANVVQTGGTAAAPTVTIGADSVIETDGTQIVSMCYDTTNNKVFVAYDNSTDTETKGAIGTVTSGTNTIAFTGLAQIRDTGSGNNFDVEFDQVGEKIIHLYRDEEDGNDLTYQVITPGASSFSVSSETEISANDNRIHNSAMSFGASKGILAGLYDAGNSSKVSYTSFYYSSSTTSNLDNGNYLGVAKASISDTATGTIVVPGGLSAGHSSLTVGNHYFTNGNGVVGLVGNTTGEQYLGRATSTTEIQLLENEGYLYGTAEGAVTAGKAVVVATDGEFEQGTVANTAGLTIATSDRLVLDTDQPGQVPVFASCHMVGVGSSVQTVVQLYQDTGNSNYYTVVAVTIADSNGTTLVAGTPVVVHSIASNHAGQIVNDPDTDTFIVVARSNHGGGTTTQPLTAYVGSVSGTTISVGSPQYSATSGSIDARTPKITYDTAADRILAIYSDSDASQYVKYVVGTVTGGTTNSIAWGTIDNAEASSNNGHMALAYDTTNNKHLLIWDDNGSMKAKVGTLTGGTTNTVSWATDATFISSQNRYNTDVDYNADADKFVLAARNSSDFYYAVASISGTTPSIGTVVSFSQQQGDMESMNWVTFLDSSNVYSVYRDSSNHFYLRHYTVSGTTLTAGTDVKLDEVNSTQMNVVGIKNKGILYASTIETTNADGSAYTRVHGSSNVTGSTPFIGFATKDVSDNGQVEVATTGQIDAQQSGLTTGQTYYVTSDGSLSTTSSDHKAGKALSATKLLIGV